MRAVYTYWTGKDEASGFRNLTEMAMMWGYSIEMTKKQKGIDEVFLVTDSRGKEVVEKYGLQFDNIDTAFDEIEVPYDFWAYPKFVAMGKQEVPFIHLDMDLFLINQLTPKMLNAPFCFQSEEVVASHELYHVTLKESQWYLPQFIKDNPAKAAYNCGIVLCNDLKLLKGWIELAEEYIFSPSNKKYHENTERQFQQNHIAEQYFLACIVNSVYEKAEVLIPNFNFGNFSKPEFKFVHLWANSKRMQVYVDKMWAKTKKDFPELYNRLVDMKDADVFGNIYKNEVWGKKSSGDGSWDENTEFYRNRLGEIIKSHKIKSVVDLGCGYWGANRLMDWQGVKYTGIDVANVVLEANRKDCDYDKAEFIYGNARTCDIPKCDLIILKDVMIHWSNDEVREFLGRDFPAKYILVNNDINGQDGTKNIQTGQFRCIDLSKKPFNADSLERDIWRYTVDGQEKTKALDLFKITKKKIHGFIG